MKPKKNNHISNKKDSKKRTDFDAVKDFLAKNSFPSNDDYLPNSPTTLPEDILLFTQTGKFVHQNISHHGRFVLLIPLNHDTRVFLDGNLINIPKQHGILLFPYQFHNIIRITDEDILWLLITFEMENTSHLHHLRNTPVKLSNDCADWLEQIVKLFKLKNTQSVHITYLLSMLLYEMTQLAPKNKNSTIKSSSLIPAHKLIIQAGQYITNNIDQPISISQIASHLNVSPSLLHKTFKKTISLPIGTFIRRTRILHSAALLRKPQYTISQVASICGFECPYTFSRTFKQVLGIAPKFYRQQHKIN